jgi:hypothetical protein
MVTRLEYRASKAKNQMQRVGVGVGPRWEGMDLSVTNFCSHSLIKLIKGKKDPPFLF